MKRGMLYYLSLILLPVVFIALSFLSAGCSGGTDFKGYSKPIPLTVEPVNVNDSGDNGASIPDSGGSADITVHALFAGLPGVPVSAASISNYMDPTGFSIDEDWDADGIPNDQETAMGKNPHVTDYPRVTIGTDYPIVMEIQMNVSGESKVYTEEITEESTEQTSTKNMDESHYAKLNQKTTPYVVKNSNADAGSNANSYGYSKSDEISMNSAFNFSVMGEVGYGGGGSMGMTKKTSKSENWSFANSFNHSSMSERTVFDDVNYVDNMDGSGMTLKNDKVMKMQENYRQSAVESETTSFGPNDGIVRAALRFKNESVDIPVKLSHVYCTLLLKKPSGKFDALSTFLLKDESGYPLEVEIGGGDETAAYAVKVDGLKTALIQKALRNGYIPVLSVFSYDMTLVDDSYYNPGVENLKQIEERSKGRTAVIKIVSPNKRELYRVTAFDTDENGNLSPGVSLKKALFQIFRSQLKGGESWNNDSVGEGLTIQKDGLWWDADYTGDKPALHEYIFSEKIMTESDNSDKKIGVIDGNEWDYFSTEVKTYLDEYNTLHRIELIKRIGARNDLDKFGTYVYQEYNPFNEKDNANYNENDPLSEEELLKTKYWVVLHNGKYYEGDINDPIWPGDRYEIILFNIMDFREHFDHFVYTPLQSGELMSFDTRWNSRVNNSEELARSNRLGTIRKGDVVRLDVYLRESRFLFDQSVDKDTGAGIPHPVNPEDVTVSPQAWWNFRYTFEPQEKEVNGIPGSFSHKVEGGINSLKVKIDESKNARYYIIDVLDTGEENAIPISIKVTAEELRKKWGEIYINSKTIDVNGNSIGIISASAYTVSVFAHGEDYGHHVQTRSNINGSTLTSVYVNGATKLLPTAQFSFSAQNLYKNAIHVRIQNDIPNVEYFLIRVYGPYNYQNGATSVKDVRGHSGLNIIELEQPNNGLNEASEEGVYEVKVFSVNKNSYNGNVENEEDLQDFESYIGAIFVNVSYDLYKLQRVVAPFKWVPEAERDNDSKAYTRSFNLDAIDLEVNFNEGSGWWRLKLANSDKGIAGKEVECRFTSIIEDYRGQHFVIRFKAPDGVENEMLNVFKSSDNKVDLYIRTVAEKKYRDTFWMKNINPPKSLYSVESNSILSEAGINNFVDSWYKMEETDASKIEETLESWRVDSKDDFSGNGNGFGLFEKEKNKDLYFFSPFEERKYYISAYVDTPDTYVETQPAMLDLPSFDAVPGPGCIYLNNLKSRYADTFDIYWKRFDRSAEYEYPITTESIGWNGEKHQPADGYVSWHAHLDVPNNGVNNTSVKIMDENSEPLSAYQYYVIAVVGKNTGLAGSSKARFCFDKNASGDNIQFVMPYPDSPPQDAPVMQLDVDKRNIGIALSPNDDQCRYVIEWKSDRETTWSKYDTYDGTKESLTWGGTTHVISNLNPRTEYTVRAYIYTLGGQNGPAVEDKITTGVEGGIVVTYSFDTDLYETNYDVGLGSGRISNLMCTIDELPVGTDYYTIEKVNISCSRYYPAWFYLWYYANIKENYQFSYIKQNADEKEVILHQFNPIKAHVGIFTSQWYDTFHISSGMIKAFDAEGTLLESIPTSFDRTPCPY